MTERNPLLKTHFLVLWTIGDGGAIPPRAITDDMGRALIFATANAAFLVAGRLSDYGLSAVPWGVDAHDVTELLAANGVYDEDKTTLIEASTSDPDDLAEWAITTADDFVQRLADAFDAATASEEATGE